MKYIVREVGKDGGAEYDNPDDAIYAAAEWEHRTDVPCVIYMRWKYAINGPLAGASHERLAVPHTIEARHIARMWRITAGYGPAAGWMTPLEVMFDRVTG